MTKPSDGNLLLIFVRNPVLGQCKTRLAKVIGDQPALDIYRLLLSHTRRIAGAVSADKWLCHSEEPLPDAVWDSALFVPKLQQGVDLGARMQHAFEEGFRAGYERICIIGSDLWDINTTDIDRSFDFLKHTEAVIGPALDGGYYLLGLRRPLSGIFQQKDWGGPDVFAQTVAHFAELTYTVLPVRNDIDLYEDIKDIKAFEPFIKHLHT